MPAEQTVRGQAAGPRTGAPLERLGNPQSSLGGTGGPLSWAEAETDTRGTWMELDCGFQPSLRARGLQMGVRTDVGQAGRGGSPEFQVDMEGGYWVGGSPRARTR